jgi:hypothetical protein
VSDSAANLRMVFRFDLAGERWNWPVAGEDSIRAFRELLHRARIGYTVKEAPSDSQVEWRAVKEAS